MKSMSTHLVFFLLSFIFGCNEPEVKVDTKVNEPIEFVLPVYDSINVNTNKAIYAPGEPVIFKLDSILAEQLIIRYKHLGKVIEERVLTEDTWQWTPPSKDFSGYMVELSNADSSVIYASIAVDVSSNWIRFPRYGFLSQYSLLSNSKIEQVMTNLNRHHINGIQFYDWHNKHHKPLPVNGSVPLNKWRDIMNRTIYLSTIEKYITAAHQYGMKTMMYNLIYGAWEDADKDGIMKEWYVYTNSSHTAIDYHPLSPPFLSSIYMLNPSNPDWQNYLFNQNRLVYEHLGFDGFHMDQLGNRGNRYTYDGKPLYLSKAYQSFIEAEQASQPEKNRVMNAVNQYGQGNIASAPTDFLYTEVWEPNENYTDLAKIIWQNDEYSNRNKPTVLAAYVNYGLADQKGFFNTPSVLLTDAVIFASGGAHLELGEHMLAKEYFPNNNLEMRNDLKTALVSYYDFLVAYENLLRDGGEFNSIEMIAGSRSPELKNWPETSNCISILGKVVDNKQVLHLLNFTKSVTNKWRDSEGIQSEPITLTNFGVVINSPLPVKKVWIASPDFLGGASRYIPFSQEGNHVSFSLPFIKYWTMIVLEN